MTELGCTNFPESAPSAVRNTFHLLAPELQLWTLDDDALLPWPECRYFRDMLVAFDRQNPDLGLRFFLTDRIRRGRPLAGSDVVVICVKDELSRMPGYAHDVRLVGKTYGVRRSPYLLTGVKPSCMALAVGLAQESIVQVRRAPSLVASAIRTVRVQRRPHVIDLPLGTYLLHDLPFVPFSERSLDASYAGSRLNSLVQSRRRTPTRKLRSRRELERSIQAVRIARPDIKLAVHIIDLFENAEDHSGPYSQLLSDSRITLCPRGGSLETYRFFEALRCGTVPICERLPDRGFYSGSPAVFIRRWADLPAVLDCLLADPVALQARHEAVVAWWEERCSPAAAARELAVALRGQ